MTEKQKEISTIWQEEHSDPEFYKLDQISKRDFEKALKSPTHKSLRKIAAQYDRPLKILEAGCGLGMTSICLALDGHEVVATDYASGMLEKGKHLAKNASELFNKKLNLSFRQASIFDLSEFEEDFDLVVSVNVLHIWLDRKKRAEGYQQMIKRLKPGGYFYTGSLHTEHPIIRFIPIKSLGINVAPASYDILSKELKSCGFEPVSKEVIGLSETWDQWVEKRIWVPIIKFGYAMLGILPTFIQRIFTPHIGMIARKPKS